MAATINVLQYLSPLRLAGPIFDKELRVASRRKISYLLRTGYVLLLAVLLLTTWYSIMGISKGNLAAFGVSRTSLVSTYVATRGLWFQFVAVQLVASVVVSFSMTEETRRGTMYVLMTTPITNVQIVLGKLLGSMLQIGLLLAMSLPVLAILRVGGGLAWQSVLAGFCITLCAAVFAGTLTLLLSTCCRQAYQVISVGALVYLVAFLVAPALASLPLPTGAGSVRSLLNLANPFYALSKVVPHAFARGGTVPGGFAWPLHCLILSAASVVLFLASWRRVRRIPGVAASRKEVFTPIERVHGAPVAWKENRGPAWFRRREDIIISVLGLGTAGLILLAGGFRSSAMSVYLSYLVQAFWLVVFLRLAISAAGGITREKESGAWAILLATPLEDKQIVRAKLLAALRRNAMLLVSALVIQILWFACLGGLRQMVFLPLMLLPRLTSVLVILACGLFFGVYLKRTTAAVTATLGAYLCLAYIAHGLVNALVFRMLWDPARFRSAMLLSFILTCQSLVVDIVVSVFCLRCGRRNLRRHIF